LSAPARSTEHLRWLPAKSNRCATSAACLGRSPKVAAETAAWELTIILAYTGEVHTVATSAMIIE